MNAPRLAVLLVLVGSPSLCRAGEPHITIGVKDGWAEFTVLQDGKPCPDVSVHVIDQQGKSFARGEAGPEGEGVFPLPGGPYFVVEVKTGARTADPIWLRRTGNTVEPERLLLSYGLLPCCRSPVRSSPKNTADLQSPSPTAESADWLVRTGSSVALLLAFVLAFGNHRRSSDQRAGAMHWRLGLRVFLALGLVALWLGRSFAEPSPRPRDLAKEVRADLERRQFRPLSASLETLLADAKYDPIPTQTHAYLLQPAPAFTLADVDGKPWSLDAALLRGPVVVVFYYGFYCDHCVSQLFGLHKDVDKFRELGVQIVAISADPPELTRERFKKYGRFAFPVLCDPDHKVAAQYGTYLPPTKPGLDGDQMHGTFVINPAAEIIWVNRGDGPFTENRALLHVAK